MPNRRRKSSPFSLFSFQDIVTSVTAVVILLTLILTLELITRQPTSAAEQLDRSVAALRAALEQADQERRSLEDRLQQQASRTLEYASTTPELIQRDLEQTNEQIRQLRQELEHLRKRQIAVKRQENAIQARSLDHNIHRKELEDLKAQAAAAESERSQIIKGNQLIFNPPLGAPKRPWLVDVSADSIVVLSFDQDGERHEFRSRLLNTCADQMIAWARRNCNAQEEYFVLLVRPSGIENADNLRDTLTRRGFDIGRDVLGATQNVTIGRSRAP
jgi:hypothetical protein